jgi:hypothetical protein
VDKHMCESEGCVISASWLVGVGTRKMDRQYTCGRHFNQVCWAMVGADKAVMLSVEFVGSWREDV